MTYEPWQAGMRITAGRLASISATWQTWTPAWTTTTGAHSPSYGNATIACDYCQTGNLVVCSFDIAFGSTTSFGGGGGSDNYAFGLPVACAASSGDTLGFITMRQSDSAQLIGRVQYNGSDSIRLSIDSGRVDSTAVTNAGIIDAVSPWTWASGNALHGLFQYRAAS
ncbi:hypothetical protein [Streptomyces sp. NPDC047028]|uniref:hypothetical protein n=1 Tax=Streptomyces sp. NPDC047028 TaxID=3155793 RepID=UPI0033D4B917